jgi:PAS domain S-box-containing protein
LPLAIFEAGRNGFLTFANRAGFEMFRVSQDDVERGIRVLELVAPADRERAAARLAQAMAGEYHGGTELTARRGDGTTFPALVFARSIESGGRPTGVRGIVADISERVEAQEALHLQGAALEAAANGIVITDQEGTVQWVNPAFTRLTGYEASEVVGRSTRILKSGVQDEAVYRELWQTIGAGKVWHGELINRRKDGTQYSEEMTITPLHGSGGAITHFIAIKQDITDRKRTAEQIRQAQRIEAVGTLAGGVAHDFNNLLQGMLSLAEVLRVHQHEPVRIAAAASELEEQIRHGASLTRQLLLFSRRSTARPERLLLNEVVEGAGRLLRRLLRENIGLELRLADDDLPVLADRGQLEQVLINLVVNASDAMPGGGRLAIRTGKEGSERVWFSVSDSGAGIPEEVRGRIFEPFFTTKGEEKGTGLGLAVVRGITSEHGGTVEVESSRGVGSTFRVILPRLRNGSPPRPREGRSARAGLPVGGGEHILVVEDEEAARDGLREMLRILGYHVEAVGSAAEVVRLPRAPAFDLLLTDLMLPDLPGTDVARGAARRWPGLKIILMSGYAKDEVVRRNVSEGHVRFLQKPFDMETLAHEVHAALEGA